MDKLGLDLGAVVFYVVNFGVLALVLNKLVYQRVIANLDERRKQISDNISQAQKLQAEFSRMLAEQKTQHQQAMAQLTQQLANSRKEAENEIANLRAQAAQERAELLADAHRQIEMLKSQIESEIADRVITKVTNIVAHALHSNLPPDKVINSISKAWISLKGKA